MKSGFYLDTQKAHERNLIGNVYVYLNGKRIQKAVRAKSGRSGFVEYYKEPFSIKNLECLTEKVRGNVKISIKTNHG